MLFGNCVYHLAELDLNSLSQWLHQLEIDLVGNNFNSPIFALLSAVCCPLASGSSVRSVVRISNCTQTHTTSHLLLVIS